jgi:hypothetical protein
LTKERISADGMLGKGLREELLLTRVRDER